MSEVICAGFTGSSKGMTAPQRGTVNKLLQYADIFKHGDCVGADEIAHSIARANGLSVIIHPPIDEKARAFCKGAAHIHPPKKYLDRNKDIVDGSDFLIATPKEYKEQLRSGTWSTIRYARKKKIPIYIVLPDGSVRKECAS